MNKLVFILTALFITNNFVFIHEAISWEGDPTHKVLTQYAAENSVLSKNKGDYLKNLKFNEGIREDLQWGTKVKKVFQWLQEGAILEDEMGAKGVRCLNHFHNPLANRSGGKWGTWEGGGLGDWVVFANVNGQSSLLWAQDGTSQSGCKGGDWSWKMTRKYYYDAPISETDEERQENFAKTFRVLGHQMHLIQDAAVPAHVRIDAHPFHYNCMGGLLLEPWAVKNRSHIESIASKTPVVPAVDLTKAINYNGEDLAPISQLVDTDAYNGSNPSTSLSIGLSEYTNANFFSDDTIFAAEKYAQNHRHYFPYPKESDTNLQYFIGQKLLPETNPVNGDARFYISKVDSNNNKIIGHFVKPTYHTTDISQESGTLYFKTFYLDEKCHEDYAKEVIPRAVGYSAVLLNYFFRGRCR